MEANNYPLVFVVEDNKAYIRTIEMFLRKNHFENLQLFVSGEECLQNLYKKPDIIIQDYKLQGISGLNVLQRTKKILPDTEFIFLSGRDDMDVAIDSVKLGAYYYIVKSDSAMPRLLQKLENIKEFQLVNRRKKRKQKFLYYLIAGVIVSATIIVIALKIN